MRKIFFLTMCCCVSALMSQAMTISEVRSQQQNTQVQTSGTVTAIYGKNLLISDHGSSILVYFSSNVTGVSVQDSVEVSGTYTTFNGWPEISSPTIVSTMQATTTVPVLETTLEDILEDAAYLIGAPVQLTNVQVSRYDSQGNLYITDGDNEMECYLMRPNQTTFPVGKEISLKAVVTFYNANVQLVGNTNDIVVYVPEQEEEPVDNPTYDFEKDGCYYNILSLSDLTVELTCRGDENEWYNNHIATYSGDFRVPETVEYSNRTFTVSQIHAYAFINCHLGTLTIPATVQRFGGYSYAGDPGDCQNLVIEDSEESISGNLPVGQVKNSVYMGRNFISDYVGIPGTYSTITFGNNVTELGRICSGNNNLTSVTLPSSVKSLRGTFSGCENLTTVSGDGVETIYEAFSYSGIQTINMPNLKQMVGAFMGCTALTTMNIPEGVVSMCPEEDKGDDGVFRNATALTSVVIPATVLRIEEYSFAGCTSLNTISVANHTPISIPENIFDMLTYLNATLKVPVGTRTTYMYAPVWQNFLNIVEDPSLVSTKATIIVPQSYDGEYEGGALEINVPDPKTPLDVDMLGYDDYLDEGYIVPVGTDITITATPYSHHKLDSLVINDNDVTAQMQGNDYTYHVSGSAILKIRAYFSYDATPQPEPELVYVRIKQATGGQIEFPMYQENDFYFFIIPEEGWQIHSVTSNGEDISSLVTYNGLLELYVEEDMNIVITFVESQASHLPAAVPSNVHVYGANDKIFVNGAAETNIRIFNEAGAKIVAQKANLEGNSFVVDKGHVYLVQVGDLTFKVAL